MADDTPATAGFFAELKRRKVWRVTAAYVVAGFAVLQSADLLVPYLGLPDWTMRLVVLLTLLGFLGRLARLIPPPRAHRHRYHGVLAPNARLRPDVIRFGRPHHELETLDALAAAPSPAPDDEGNGPARSSSPARVRWAQLLARVYQLDPLRCPGCHGTLRILAFLTEPDVVEGILRHLGLPHRPPRIAPARAPPQAEIDFDQTPPWDRDASSSPPPLPQLHPFDQSLPGDDGTWSA